MTFRIHGRIRLGNEEVFLPIAREIIDLIGYATFLYFSVGRFDEAEFIDPGKGAHRADQTDVRTFRRFDWADSTVVRWMDVADFEACAITAQTSWPESRETSLVGQLR